MRLLLGLLLVLGLTFSAQAQTFTPSVKSKTSKVSAPIGVVTIAGKEFKGGTSSSGSIFIVRVSKKSGKEYKNYLGTPLKGKSYNGSQIYWANKKGEKIYFYFTINKSTGYPKRNHLDAN